MKLITGLMLFVLLLQVSVAQAESDPAIADELKLVHEKLELEKARNTLLQNKLLQMEQRFNLFSDSIQKLLNSNLLIQAQNERAVNITLDEFSEKFKEQNRTMDGVRTALDKQWSQQLMIYGVAFLVFLAIMLFEIRRSNKKALNQQRQSWNEFNEYIIKRK